MNFLLTLYLKNQHSLEIFFWHATKTNIIFILHGNPTYKSFFAKLLYYYTAVFKKNNIFSNGLICSVGMLFIMLILLMAAIALCGWKMNKLFGVIMIISYIVFCIISVSLETGKFICPLRICWIFDVKKIIPSKKCAFKFFQT